MLLVIFILLYLVLLYNTFKSAGRGKPFSIWFWLLFGYIGCIAGYGFFLSWTGS